MDEISFCTTATCRPEILDKTYFSFKKYLNINFSKLTLYINIDPLPDTKKRSEVIDVSKSYFGTVVSNEPDSPNFTRAINWLWSTANTPYIFHLEDDWELLDFVDVNDVLKLLSQKNIWQVILRAYSYKYSKMPLSPSFIKKEAYKIFAGNLDESMNPEIQLRHTISYDNLKVIPDSIIVQDIGRLWLKKSGFKKPSTKGKFNKWDQN